MGCGAGSVPHRLGEPGDLDGRHRRVASGVTSVGATPVPPQVSISAQPALVGEAADLLFDRGAVVCDDLAARDLGA